MEMTVERAILQSREQLSHREGLTRQQRVRRNLAQRMQHETAQMRLRMRQRQLPGRTHLGAERNQIQIQRTRLIDELLRSAAELLLQLLQLCEERFGRLPGSGNHRHHRIHKIRRAGRTTHRSRLPQGGPEERTVREQLQPVHRLPDQPRRITQIGSQRNDSPLVEFRSRYLEVGTHFSPSTSCMS
jgi:hypothetical protein